MVACVLEKQVWSGGCASFIEFDFFGSCSCACPLWYLLVHAHCGIFSLVVKGLGIGVLRVRGLMN